MRLQRLVPAAIFVLSSCVDAGDPGTDVAPLTSDNGIAYNGIAYNGIAYNGLSYNGIAYNGFSLVNFLGGRSPVEAFLSEPFGRGVIAEMLVNDPTGVGRDLVAYSARCGLPRGMTATIDRQRFEGNLGLLTGVRTGSLMANWPTRGLDSTGVRWWFACMLAHVNNTGRHVPISVRARHPRIDTADPGFPYFEGAFWGDLATPMNPGENTKIMIEKTFACYGKDQLVACGNNPAMAAWKLWQRFCAQPGGCPNFKVVGQCLDYDGSGQYACSEDDGVKVSDCHTAPSLKPGEWGGAASYGDAVMSVYLAEIDCEIDADFPMR